MVDVIPFTNFKEKMRIIKAEQKRNRKVVVDGNNVYSFKREGNKEFKNFKCNRVKKITPGMKMDSDECVRLDEKGESKDCFDCYCSICIMQ